MGMYFTIHFVLSHDTKAHSVERDWLDNINMSSVSVLGDCMVVVIISIRGYAS